MKKVRKFFTGKRIIIAVIVIALAVLGYKLIAGNGAPQYITEVVSYRNVVKEVSETGMIKISEQAVFSFRSSGKINEIYVKIGDKVEAGEKLVQLDANQLYIELSQAQAALEVARADYDKLLAGSSSEQIKVAETDVLNAQVNLDNLKQTLEDTEADAEEALNQEYENGKDSLDDAYLKIYNALTAADQMKRKYFGGSDQEGIVVQNSKNAIESALNDFNHYIDIIVINPNNENIEIGLAKAKDSLSKTRDGLIIIRNAMESSTYRDAVSSADKTSIDNQKSYINTSYSAVLAASQAIATIKINNEKNINSAKANVSSAEVALEKAQGQLNLIEAGPTQETIGLYSAKIKQAETQVNLLQNNINESVLKSFGPGQIVQINKRKGETVQPGEAVVTFLPEGPFQVEVDVYEEDIIDVALNNYVQINIPAFLGQTFSGRVVSIDPAEKLIDGVVYYEVNISLENADQRIKPGMTADVVIEAQKKENVLAVPLGAVEKKDGQASVKVYQGKNVESRPVVLGLEGENYAEIISGLSEGEQVITGQK